MTLLATRHRWTALALVSALSSACGSDADSKSVLPSPEDATKDFVRFEVTWKKDAVILEDARKVLASLESADSTTGELIFDPGLADLSLLTPGVSAMIGGVGVFSILEREADDPEGLIRVEPAPLTAVIEEGEIAWRKSFVSSPSDVRAGIGVDGDEAAELARLFQPLGVFDDGRLSYSGTFRTYQLDLELGPGAQQGLDFSLEAKKQTAAGMVSANFSGNLTGAVNETAISLVGGEVTSFDMRFLNVAGNVEIDGIATNVGGEVKIKAPVSMMLPFAVGPIPMRFELGASFELASTLTVDSTANVHGSARFNGEVGARGSAERPEYYSTFQLADVRFEASEVAATVAAGFDALLTFPEMKIGVGLPGVISGESFVRFKAEALTNYSVRIESVGGFPIPTGDCTVGSVNFGATAGASVEFLGITLADTERSLFTRHGPQARRGNACD